MSSSEQVQFNADPLDGNNQPLTVNLNLLADQLNGLAQLVYGVHKTERPEWYEGLSGLLSELEYRLTQYGQVEILTTESE